MILLQTQHFSVFTDARDPRPVSLSMRTEAAADQIARALVTVEEMLRG